MHIHPANIRFSVVGNIDGENIHCAQFRDIEDAFAHADRLDCRLDAVNVVAVTVNGDPVEDTDAGFILC